jgi:glycosyltransferase involved in cell wall biosynthesis
VKLLFISPRYSGGIGGHANILATKLREYGYEVDIMKVPHIPIKNLKNPSFAILSSFKVMLTRSSYDIIHAFNLPSAFAMKFAKGKKKILSLYGVYQDQMSILHSKSVSSIVKNVEPKIIKWADAITTDSKATQKRYKELLGVHVDYLPTAIDTKKFQNIPKVEKKEGQIAYIGRDSFEKGTDILRKAESKIEGKIVYCTNLPWEDAMTVLKSSQLMVVPSRMESSPTTIKESFFLKVPVVATKVGGIPELIENGKTGILIHPEDPLLLAKTVNELLNDKKRQKTLTDAAYDLIIKNMTWNDVLPMYVNYYENMLNS